MHIIHHIHKHIYIFYFTHPIHIFGSSDLHGRLAALGFLCPIVGLFYIDIVGGCSRWEGFDELIDLYRDIRGGGLALVQGCYIPVCFVPVRYFPTFLRPCTFHPWMSHNQQNRTNHTLVGHLAYTNITLDMVSHHQQNSTNPWIG